MPALPPKPERLLGPGCAPVRPQLSPAKQLGGPCCASLPVRHSWSRHPRCVSLRAGRPAGRQCGLSPPLFSLTRPLLCTPALPRLRAPELLAGLRCNEKVDIYAFVSPAWHPAYSGQEKQQ